MAEDAPKTIATKQREVIFDGKIKDTRQKIKTLTSEQNQELLKSLAAMNDIYLTSKKYEEILNKVDKLNKDAIKAYDRQLTQEEKKRFLNGEVLKIKSKLIGVTTEEMKLMKTAETSITGYAARMQDNINKASGLSAVIGRIPGMGGLIKDAQGIGMNVAKAGDFALNLGANIGKAGVALKSFIASTGVGLAIMAALAAATFTFQNIMKFNVGNLSAIFGSTMAFINNRWAVFETRVAGALNKIGPMFQSVFQGVADVVTTIVDIALEFGEVFYETFAEVTSVFNEMMGTTDSLGGSFSLIKTILESLRPVIKIIAYMLGGVAAVIMVISSAFGKVYQIIADIINAIKEMSSAMPDWAKTALKIASFGSSSLVVGETPGAEKTLNKESKSSAQITSSTQTQNTTVNAPQTFTMNLSNATPETVDYAFRKAKMELPDLNKAAHMG